jgi:translation initiation factor IF-1
MSKEKIEVEATVREEFKGGQFLLELGNGHKVMAYICGKMRLHKIRIVPQDMVLVSLSPFDLSRGIITRRLD